MSTSTMTFRPALTPRERDILGLVCQSKRNREIGELLGMSEGSVKNMLYSIFNKCGCDTRLQLAILATERGWLKS